MGKYKVLKERTRDNAKALESVSKITRSVTIYIERACPAPTARHFGPINKNVF
jgi:hypothetical protein